MKRRQKAKKMAAFSDRGIGITLVGILLALLFLPVNVLAFTLNVQGEDGLPVDGFRWVLEQDTTYAHVPGVQSAEISSLGFFRSYSPVLASGEVAGSFVDITIPGHADLADPRFYVSVAPYSGYTIAGSQVNNPQPGSVINLIVNKLPLPTAQISVELFLDNHPTNGAQDQPEESFAGMGDPAGWTIIVEDSGGRYGATGGPITQDAYGNPLGTVYEPGVYPPIIKLDGLGNPMLGDGSVHPDAAGKALIKNLPPAKYGIVVVPPTGLGWIQVSTIEGTQTIDAWVKPNEPPFFAEFGPAGPHVFVGFIQEFTDATVLSGGSTVSGQIVNQHMSRPPTIAFFNGEPFPECYVGLNQGVGGPAVFAQKCDANSGFSIPNVPEGLYQLVVWDANLNIVIAFLDVTVPADGSPVDLAEVPVFNWFNRMEAMVYFDTNGNGIRETGEPGIPEQVVNLRLRDGTVYQSLPTDLSGSVPFDQVFPFFHWLIAEVDFTRYMATGATYVVDGGGPVFPDNGWVYPSYDAATPQVQNQVNPLTGNDLSTTITGPILTLGYQGFLGQTNVIEFGKAHYPDGQNGGITGIVFYAVTRAEDDPRWAVGEEWEPGIPRVTVNLYQDMVPRDGVIDDLNLDGAITLSDVDNFPFGNFPGSEDVDRNNNTLFDLGDALQRTTTDSWDDNNPTGCVDSFVAHPGTLIESRPDCYDGLRNFNQIREAVFDGGYAFDSYMQRDAGGNVTGLEITGLPVGIYVVEAVPPLGYDTIKEEDKNVDFGDTYVPSLLLDPAICVGDLHSVPQYLSWQNDAAGTPLPGIAGADLIGAPFALSSRPLCDRKEVSLSNGMNSAADFFMFTKTPIAAHVIGGILNDLANEFDPNSPNFGEKMALPWAPVSFRDYQGKEISRVYSDEFGKYNALLPSTYTVNIPSPTGVSPSMITACMNDAGPIPNPAYIPPGQPGYDPNIAVTIPDPWHNPSYSQFCYTLQYMPGFTTYLDTPVIPVAAFAGPDQLPLDCEEPTETPMLTRVDGPDPTNGNRLTGGPYAEPGQRIKIRTAGWRQVPNPEFDGVTNTKKTISRKYSFSALPGAVTVDGINLNIIKWQTWQIVAELPVGLQSGQLIVTNADGTSSPMGITLTVGPIAGQVYRVLPGTPTAIQDAIDLAQAGDLILVAPGIYDELPILNKPLQLQGYGALSTTLNGRKVPAEKLVFWQQKGADILAAGGANLLPGQAAPFDAPGLWVIGKNNNEFRNAAIPARIDGFTFVGGSDGAIYVNGYATDLQISNNIIKSNQGAFGGGVIIGNPLLTSDVGGLHYVDAENDRILIHHNKITSNGGINGAGGIAIYTGADNYSITDNRICGNFSSADGAGIGHLGLSRNGKITGNKILFNQNFNQGSNVHGGGLFIGGKAGLAGPGSLTPGSGNVKVEGNIIQGNQAGAGDGGGIALQFVNGDDVANNPATPAKWYRVDILDNIIVNNMAGDGGGGIALQDVINARIIHNTVANNDSTATVGNAFTVVGNSNITTARPGVGLLSRGHIGLDGLMALSVPARFREPFSNPAIQNDIFWHNRSFNWGIDTTTIPSNFGLIPNVGAGELPVYDDLAVLGVVGAKLNPVRSVLTDAAGYHVSNINADPLFIREYVNGDRGQTIQQTEQTTTPQTAAAFDEGGNFIEVRFGPLTPLEVGTGLLWDYHIDPASPATALGVKGNTLLNLVGSDIDGDLRPLGALRPDAGADEVDETLIP